MEQIFLKMKQRSGFTLLELLITIAIIGILISVSVVSYAAAQRKSRDSRRMSDLKAIQAGFEQYYANNNGTYNASCSVDTTYMPAGMPTDPQPGKSYDVFNCSTSTYCVCATLESTAGNASNNDCTYGSGPYFCVSNLQ
jgi:type IV pilus assembly protein PilA